MKYFPFRQNLYAHIYGTYMYHFFNNIVLSMKHLIVSSFLVLLVWNSFSQSPTIQSIGPTPSDFTSITAAISAVQSSGLSGPTVWELKSGYNSNVETFPLTFPSLPGASETNTLTIRPAGGVTGLSIHGTSSTAIINLNGARYLIFDGRPGESGSKSLVISNENAGGPTVQFVNGACNNIFRYCIIKGIETASTSAVVLFSTTTAVNGNNSNRIENCDVCPGDTKPTNLVSSQGSNSFPYQLNRNNVITNCNLFNWFPNDFYTNAIYLKSGTDAWTITKNSFYQTESVYSPPEISAITISSGGGYTIDSNWVGGDSPHASVTSIPMYYSGAAELQMMSITTDPYSRTTIEGNVFNNICITTSNTSKIHAYIYIKGGNVDVGGLTGNQIGNQSTTGSMQFTSSGSESMLSGIYVEGSTFGDTVMIRNNTIGSITCTGTYNSNPTFNGIALISDLKATSLVYVGNNIIGSPSTANSITTTGMNYIYGIYCKNYGSRTSTIELNANQIAHLQDNSNASDGIYGVYIDENSSGTSPYYHIHNNLVDVLQSYGAIYIDGIRIWSQDIQPVTIAHNEVRFLSRTAATVNNTYIAGIIAGNYTGSITGNFIHNLNSGSSVIYSSITGIYVNNTNRYSDSVNNVCNNMVQLGITDAGSSISNGGTIIGILDFNGPNNYCFNSVYIGGNISGSSSDTTFAFKSNYQGYSADKIKIMNNIFYNGRSGGGSGCHHYAISLPGVGVNPPGIISNHNIFLANGTGGILGKYGANKSTMADWRNVTGMDYNSICADPNFIAPAGSLTTVNMHLQSPTPAEHTGFPLPDFPCDFDGETRSSLTPDDIGADASTFTAAADIQSPDISFTPLTRGLTTNRSLTNFATINDNTCVSSGTNLPRLYYKCSTDANSFVGNLPANPGWKYAIATNSSSPYSFLIDYSLLYGGSISGGTTIQYFVVAQDDANNLSSYPAGAAASGNPPVQYINAAPATPLTYIVTSSALSGNISLPADYTSLSGTSGFFSALQQKVVTGNITVTITGNLSNESNTYQMIPWAEEPVGSNYSITFVPSDASEKVISISSSSVYGDMIMLEKVKNVTFDGSFNGSGKYLRFKSSKNVGNKTLCTITIDASCSNITFKNCIIEGYSTYEGYGVMCLRGNNNTIIGCTIRDCTSSTGIPYNLLYCEGGTDCHNNTITNNELMNFSKIGIQVEGYGTGGGWNISGNNIYQTMSTPPTTAQTGIYFNAGALSSGNTISDNWIGGSTVHCEGSYWINNTTSSVPFYGIRANTGESALTSVQNNTIRNISIPKSESNGFIGISLQNGWFNAGDITGNTVGDLTKSKSISVNGTSGNSVVKGIEFSGVGILANSLVANVRQTNLAPGFFYGLTIKPSSHKPISVLKNRVLSCGPVTTGASSGYQISGIYINGNFPSKITVANNMVSLGNGLTGGIVYYGIWRNVSSDNSKAFVCFNSVYIGGTENGYRTSYAFVNTYANYSVVRNNVFYNCRSGSSAKEYAIALLYGVGSFNSDYNDIYSTVGPAGCWMTTDFASLSNWQAGTASDLHSVSILPTFTSATDLHILDCPYPNNKGTYLPDITTDYDGNTRENPPDPGINEFNLIKTWNGSASSDWNMSGNWTPPGVPMILHDVYIGPGSHDAIINQPGMACHTLTVNENGHLVVNNGKTLFVNGDVTVH
jgi:hypothetical protein